jgi:hypothetical protein
MRMRYLQHMKRSTPLPPLKPMSAEFPHEVVVVSAPTRSTRPRTVTVEWRDAAGELHCAVLSPERSKAWVIP